jgi:hypothetical protein
VRLVANLIAQSIGRPEMLKYFDDREEALVWLKAFKKLKKK